jgi:hypothetical protein
VAPPADGLRLAFVAARRRRNRKAGATGAAGLLAAVALLASTGGGGSSTTLQQEPLPPSTSRLGLVPGGGEPTAGPVSTTAPVAPSQGDVMSASRTGVFAPPAGQAARPGGSEQMTTGSNGGLRAQSTQPVSGPMSRSTGFFYTNDLMCPARKQQERQRGLCTDVYIGQSATNTMSITAEVCNVGAATEVLSYDTARELDVSVRRSGLDVWRWSLGRQFGQTPHDITVGAQECIQWTTSWAQVDSHGVRVKAGSYIVVADLDANEVAAADRHPSYSFTVSPQS